MPSQLVFQQKEHSVIEGESQQSGQSPQFFSPQTSACEECNEHEDERNDVSKNACSEALTDGAAQSDAISYLQSGVVTLDFYELFLAFAAAAKLSCLATTASRSLKYANRQTICSDAFHDTFVPYQLLFAHITHKIAQRYDFFRLIPNYNYKYFVNLWKKCNQTSILG